MERRKFGRTGMETSVLGFGSSEIGYSATEQATVDRMLNAALDSGLNVIDTAECYMEAEALIGNAISHRRQDYYLFTKCGHGYGVETGLPDWHPDLITGSIEHSLKRLKTDCLDLVQLHSCSKEVLAQGDVVDRLQRAKAEGKTRFIGYSGDGQNARYALEMGVFDSLQTSVNIADQQCVELLLPWCAEHNIGVIAKRPVANIAWRNWPDEPGSGYARPYWERLQRLNYPLLSREPSEIAEAALRFTISQPAVCTAIVGTTKPERLTENARSVAKGADPTQIAEIRQRWKEVAPPEWEGLT